MPSIITPIYRIFDYRKTIEFYVEWLGFTVDWEHRYDENSPVYMQVSRGDVKLHLSEHHGDGCPGARARIETPGVSAWHAQLPFYKYNRPGIQTDFNGQPCFTAMDPFGNHLTFIEQPI